MTEQSSEVAELNPDQAFGEDLQTWAEVVRTLHESEVVLGNELTQTYNLANLGLLEESQAELHNAVTRARLSIIQSLASEKLAELKSAYHPYKGWLFFIYKVKPGEATKEFLFRGKFQRPTVESDGRLWVAFTDSNPDKESLPGAERLYAVSPKLVFSPSALQS